MDHLEQAKEELVASEGADLHWQEKYLRAAQVHALIALVERLDRLTIETKGGDGTSYYSLNVYGVG